MTDSKEITNMLGEETGIAYEQLVDRLTRGIHHNQPVTRLCTLLNGKDLLQVLIWAEEKAIEELQEAGKYIEALRISQSSLI